MESVTQRPQASARADEAAIDPNTEEAIELRRLARMRTASDFSMAPAPKVNALAGHRNSVHLLKIALPLLALALIVTMVIFSVLYRPDGSIAITYSDGSQEKGELVMKSPRFVGSNKDNEPFEILAKEARQHTEDRAIVELDGVDAKLKLNTGIQLRLIANQGVLDTNNRLLRMTGPIELTSSQGFTVHTSEARADLENGTLTGEHPIEASGSFGTVRADGFVANREAQSVSFVGHVSIRFYPQTEAKQ